MENLKMYFPVLVFILLTLFMVNNSNAQCYDPLNGNHCTIVQPPLGDNPYDNGGAYKPERTDTYPGTNGNSVFRILIVFVEYQDEPYTNNPNWIAGQEPSYMNSLLALNRSTNYGNNWWDAYSESTQKISDYFMEVSRGHFHVVGKCYHIVLDHTISWYQQTGRRIQAINSEVCYKLDHNFPDLYWQDYDNWSYYGGIYHYVPDNQIDMLYEVFRTWADVDVTPGSISQLYSFNEGNYYTVSTGQVINSGFSHDGSGCTFTPGAACGGPCGPFSDHQYIPIQAHELGHYLFGYNHANYGLMMGDKGSTFATGLDSRLSPWETIKLGYASPNVVVFDDNNHPSYTLSDYSSRDNSSNVQVLQIPINGNYEFFLLANRMQVSSYDRIMSGDTAHDDAFRNINTEYGKGLYIYHTPSGYIWTPDMDKECADGLFNWTLSGTFHPDWSTTQELPVFLKESVSYANGHL